jgi:hypothetical protein
LTHTAKRGTACNRNSLKIGYFHAVQTTRKKPMAASLSSISASAFAKAATLAACVAFGSSGCKHEEAAPAPAPELPELQKQALTSLTAHKWRMSSYVKTYSYKDMSAPVTVDMFAQMPPCRRDDFLQFNADYTLQNDEGPTRCSLLSPQSQAANWVLFENGVIYFGNVKLLNLPYDVQTHYNDLARVTDTKLTITVYNTGLHLGEYDRAEVEYTAF